MSEDKCGECNRGLINGVVCDNCHGTTFVSPKATPSVPTESSAKKEVAQEKKHDHDKKHK